MTRGRQPPRAAPADGDPMNIISRLKDGLSKTRTAILTSFQGQTSALDGNFYETLEEALIRADIGADLSTEVVELVKERAAQDGLTDPDAVYGLTKRIIADGLTVVKPILDFPPKPWVVLVVGVNGVGKTTTIGKLASEYRGKGKNVMLGAADTFRAGAIEQLSIWAQRTGCEFVSQQEGADPASVAFDALEAAKARGLDVLILDTAGRLHNKVNLMNELDKIRRVVNRNTPHAPNEVLLVIDATTGQNAVKQVQVFHESLGVTGLIMTKLDGTAKGGIALALTRRFGIPIVKIGVGEGMSDLQDFSPNDYVDAMLGSLNA
jgi:fused signal recognition particle receptor